MMLGRNHGDSIHGNLWACAKWLELCPVGTVVRNGCDHRAHPGEGTHLIKVSDSYWVPCNPRSYKQYDLDVGHVRAVDIWLPVQVVRQGKDEQ